MAVGHRYAADDRTYDPHEPLIGPTQKQILQMRGSIKLLFGRSIDRTVVMRGESPDCLGRKDIRFDHMPTKIGDEPHT